MTWGLTLNSRNVVNTLRDNVSVILILITSFVGSAAFRVSIPAVAFYTRGVLEASALGVGLLTSSFFAARALFAVMAGGLADKYKFKVTYAAALCFLLNALVVNLYPLTYNIIEVIAIRFLQGALNGIAWVSIQIVLGTIVKSSIRGRMYSIYFALGTLGNVFGNAFYSKLSDKPLETALIASSILFTVTSALTLSVGITFSVTSASSVVRLGKPKSSSEGGYLGLTSAIPLVLTILGIGMFGSILRGDLIYVYTYEFFNISKGSVAELIGLTSLIALIGGYLLSWLSDKVNDVIALRIGVGIGFLGSLLLSTNVLVGLIAGLILLYVANSSVVPITRKIAVTYYRLGGTVVGLVNAVGNLSNVVGASLAGLLYDVYGLSTITILGLNFTEFILLMSAAMIVSFITSLTILKR